MTHNATTSSTSTTVVHRTAPNHPALWTIDPAVDLDTGPQAVDGLDQRADLAITTLDPSSLLMVLAESVEAGHHRTSGRVATAALHRSLRDLPGVSAERLYAMAIGGGIDTDATDLASLGTVAAQLRLSALMQELDLTAPPLRLASRSAAVARAERLATTLERVAAGRPTELVPLIRDLSFFGLLNIARALARITTAARGTATLEVSIAAQIRRRVGPGRGLQAQLDVLADNPGNTAARNSACACLVDLGMPEAGLDHLAVSLLAPDHYVGNTARRALREAGYLHLVPLAYEIADLMAGRYPGEATPEVKRHAANILAGIRRRAATEIAMVNLTGALTPERIFRGRQMVDANTVGATS